MKLTAQAHAVAAAAAKPAYRSMREGDAIIPYTIAGGQETGAGADGVVGGGLTNSVVKGFLGYAELSTRPLASAAESRLPRPVIMSENSLERVEISSSPLQRR